MHLKSLVLKGFKSFADRSALTLEPGITAIVGPNGSGKSNISDAVLWVLGERNAKHLRGQAMEDVIFAGSSARRAAGLAEVDLVLDNSDGTLPVDYDEVAITRRMYRSGESEYLINGTVARRMDVLDILHDSGLGTGTHSIISQGSLDSILQSKPEDRRALIEEAAGTLKHKQRKAKSERKLAQMDQHLARVRDVTAEVERQLKPLERKAKRARTYIGLSAELSDLKLKLAVDDLRQLQEKHAAATAREEAVAAELEAKRAEISTAEAAAEALQEKIRQEGASAGELTRQHRQASSAVERIESAELVMRERKRAATSRAGELAVSLEANAARTKTAQADLDAANAQLASVQAERAQVEEKVSRLAADHADVTSRRAETEKRATELGRASRDLESRINSARAKHAELKEALTNGLAHMKIIEGHTQELTLQFDRAQAEASQAEAHAQKLAEELSALEQVEKESRIHVGEAVRAAEAARAARDEASDAERACAASIEALREVERASAKAQGPALEWLASNAAAFDAAVAPLSHEISAPEGQEALVEHLLGADVAALLVADGSHAAKMVDALAAEGKNGEVTLVLRDDANGVSTPDASARPAGALGRALLEGLSFPESSARAVRALLGDVVVCENLEEALAAHEADTLGLRFAAPDGCIVWPTGKVVAGRHVDDGGQGALARARRLEELSRELVVAKEATQKANEAADAADGQRTADHSAEHVAQVAQLAVDGHRRQRVGVGLVGAVEQLIVEFVELLDGGILVAENLDDLLAVHHFLDVAVDLAQLLLLLEEVLAGVAGEILGGQHHSADHDQGQYAQRHAEVKHGQKYADYRNDRIDQLGQALADELAQGINIVGVDRHDVAVGVAVKILDGQGLHVDEQVVAQTFQGALGDLGHGAVLDEDGQDAHAVEAGYTGDGMQQAGEIVALFGQQGQDVAVDQSLHKQGALDLSEHAEQNAAQHQDDLELVLLHHVGQDALEHLAGVLYFGTGACVAAGAHFYYFRLLCHQASPPFSSKSPEPLVWLL